jgi:small subunit ribosomal protein S9
MAEIATKKSDRYYEAVGRRKTSIARVRITPEKKTGYVINGKDLNDYFKTEELRKIATEAIAESKVVEKFGVSVKILGGGIHSQAEALRHGIARALTVFDLELRKSLKKAGFIKRDPRAKERRKFGLKKARKAPQWSKR